MGSTTPVWISERAIACSMTGMHDYTSGHIHCTNVCNTEATAEAEHTAPNAEFPEMRLEGKLQEVDIECTGLYSDRAEFPVFNGNCALSYTTMYLQYQNLNSLQLFLQDTNFTFGPVAVLSQK